jgi:myo-inositol 2-dehydrogenase/D-chiro-inositol 1-dehydrogenase
MVESTVSFAGPDGIISDKPLPFFLERYADAYRRELDHFIGAIASGAAPLVGGGDGVKALALADAALEIISSGPPGQGLISRLWRASRCSESARSTA